MMNARLIALTGVVVALFSAALLAAACDGDEEANGNGGGAEAATVDVAVVDFDVNPSVDTVEAGAVTFRVANDGAVVHNFRVIKTDLAPDALPIDSATSKVDEGQVDVRASRDDISPGSSVELTVDLEPGSYVLICNIPTHYQRGTLAGFTVE